MAKFLDTQAISNELMKLIKDAKEKIIFVSYSFKVNPQIQERLKTKSKVGTLAEIVIVYGRTELKSSELEWIKEIQDLKIYEKPNLHAKCYLNEDRAIICSMNLYDYSQQNNIEMGILITKKDDPQAYEELMDEINNIKVNGIRKNPNDLENKIANIQPFKAKESVSQQVEKNVVKQYSDLNQEQKLNWQLLKKWRLVKSKFEGTAAFHILTDEEITQLVSLKKIDKNSIYDVIAKKKAIKYGDEILYELSQGSRFTLGKVINVWYQSDDSVYDRVKLKFAGTGEEKWFDTTQELPQKDKVVAVRLNNTWFNEYFYLDN